MPVDDQALQAALDSLIVKIGTASRAAVSKAVLAVEAAGMAGTPVLTGTLRRSWRMESLPTVGGIYAARTGPTTVYARRIELGFKGPDSLGRVYNQQGNPYVKPAYDKMLPEIRPFVVGELTVALRGV